MTPIRTPVRTRVRLGSAIQMSEREHIYLVDDAVEVDQVDGYEVTRRRVFFTDIEAVTLHRERRVVPLVALGLATTVGLLISIAISLDHRDVTSGLIVMAFIALPFALLFLRMLLVPACVIAVFGTRTKATMRFSFRIRKAERVFQQICERAADGRTAP